MYSGLLGQCLAHMKCTIKQEQPSTEVNAKHYGNTKSRAASCNRRKTVVVRLQTAYMKEP